MAELGCDDFAAAVRAYLECTARLKEAQRLAKVERERITGLKQSIISYMEMRQLDICNIQRDGQNGQLAVRKAKSTKGVKRQNAVETIVNWIEEHHIEFDEGNPSTKADELWEKVMDTRVTEEKKDLTLRA